MESFKSSIKNEKFEQNIKENKPAEMLFGHAPASHVKTNLLAGLRAEACVRIARGSAGGVGLISFS
jgi:hypothetical protein